MGVANAPASRPEELTRADLAPTMPCCATVVPALLLLLLLAQSGVSQEGQKVKFGARVEQAKSKCSGRSAKCQFGFTFKEEESGRERNVIFVQPREEEEEEESNRRIPSPRQRLPPPEETYFEMGREVGKRLRFDPRKRQQKDRASVEKNRTPPTARAIRPRPPVITPPTESPHVREQPVTITIGGVSLVIPDFGLEPATPAQEQSLKPMGRPAAGRTSRPRPRPRISPSRFSGKRVVPSQTTRRPAITPVQRTTTPRTFTSTLSSFEELASTINDLSNSLSSGRGSGRGFARGFVRDRVVTSAAPGRGSSAPGRARGRTRARQRGSSERRKKPTIQDESSTENLAEPELGECPGSLEGCVTACIPLEDVY